MIDMVHEYQCLIFLFRFNKRGMFYQMKPIFAPYFLHILQGQASGLHTLISFLNYCKDL